MPRPAPNRAARGSTATSGDPTPPNPASGCNADGDRATSVKDRRRDEGDNTRRVRKRSLGPNELKDQLQAHRDDVYEPLLERQALARLRLSVARETVTLLKGPMVAARAATAQAESDVAAFARAVGALSDVGRSTEGRKELPASRSHSLGTPAMTPRSSRPRSWSIGTRTKGFGLQYGTVENTKH